jgi:hypothetical protein
MVRRFQPPASTNGNGLGMTRNYTHTRPKTRRQQIEQAVHLWPASLRSAAERIAGAAKRPTGQQGDRAPLPPRWRFTG